MTNNLENSTIAPRIPSAGMHPKERAGQSLTKAHLTDRDRQLIAVLAMARHLSNEQLAKLFFAGRSVWTMRKRLLRLAGEGTPPFRPAYLRRIFYRAYEGRRVEIWGLTAVGYAIARRVIGTPTKVPRGDVGAAFREHLILLNELLVALLAEPRSGYPRANQIGFKWVPTDSVRLPWKEYVPAKDKSLPRVVLPDAVLEIPCQRRRLFLECETGAHSILGTDDQKPGSTLSKVENYESFLYGLADYHGHKTFCAQAYPDQWTPEVLFVVRDGGRATSINRAIAEWRVGRGGVHFSARALTVGEAARELCLAIRKTPIASAKGTASAGAASHVSLKPEDIVALRDFYNATVLLLKQIRAKARSQKQPPPAYPAHTEAVQALIERVQSEAMVGSIPAQVL